MNNFRLKTTKNAEGQPIGPHTAYIKLSGPADADNNFGGILRTHFELALMRGRREPRPAGGARYWLELTDDEAALLSQVLTMCFYGVPPVN